ncbi:hypothetical protein ACNKHO_24160 [Shigella flexneri]
MTISAPPRRVTYGNSFRDVNIAFANELSLICADQGITVWELIRLANRHLRVKTLQPGRAWVGTVSRSIRGLSWRKMEQARRIRTAREVPITNRIGLSIRSKATVADCPAASGKRASEARNCLLWSGFKPNIDDCAKARRWKSPNDRYLATAVKRWWLSRIFVHCRQNLPGHYLYRTG